MGIANYLKEIGRGKEGARSLSDVQAEDLMSQVLDRKVSEAERGAFAIAMRVKGESTEELAGFTRAAAARSVALDPAALPVLLPSYNGARKLPNLTALLALLLAQEGVPVLVHGPERDPGRAGQSGEIDDQKRIILARTGQRIAKDQPSFRVGIVDFDLQSLAG